MTMNEKIVHTKQELRQAVKEKAEVIIIKGKLANKIHKTNVFSKVGMKTSKWENQENINMAGATIMAAFTGIDIAIIIVAASVSLSLIISVWRNYSEVEVDSDFIKFKLKK